MWHEVVVWIWHRVSHACGLNVSQLSHQDTSCVYFLSLPCDKLQVTSLTSRPQGCSLCLCPFFSFFPFLLHVLPRVVLLFNVKWGHGHTWMYCDKLAQRRQMVMGRRLVVMPFAAATWIDLRAAEQPHMLRLCNPDFSYPMCTHPLTHTPQQFLTHMPPYTSLPSPLVSMMCAAEAFANCQRLSAWLHSERRGDAEGFWQRDRAQTNGRLVGLMEPQHTAYYRDTYRHWCTVHVSRLFYLQCCCLNDVYPWGFGTAWLKSPWVFFIATWLLVRSQFVWQDWHCSLDCVSGMRKSSPNQIFFTAALGRF